MSRSHPDKADRITGHVQEVEPAHYRYKAFISYSHAADGKLAPALQSALQRFAKPWFRRRALHVFRDRTSLSADPALWPTIEQALDASEYFVLLASPDAAASKWVRREVQYWLDKAPVRATEDKKLFIVLTDGELFWDEQAKGIDWGRSSGLPPNIEGAFSEEPNYVDLRWARDEEHLSLNHARFRDAVADLAAPMHGVAKDDIAGEAVRQHRKTMRLAVSAISVLAILLVAVSIAAVLAVLNRQLALDERDRALIGQSRFVAALSKRETSAGNAVAGELLALEGLPDPKRGSIRPYVAEAEAALYESRSIPRELSLLEEHEDVVWRAAISRDQARVATASWDHTARIWDVSTGRRVALLKGHTDTVRTVDFSPDGAHLVTASNDHTARIWDAASGAQLAVLQHGALVSRASYDDAGTLIVTASYDDTARLWDAADGRLMATLVGHLADVTDAVFSPDGRTVATMSWDRSIRVWDVSSGRESTRLLGHDSRITSVAFSRDGSRILSGSEDNTARLWDVRSGNEIRAYSDNIDSGGRGVDRAAFSPDDMLIAASVFDVLAEPTERLTYIYDAQSHRRMWVLDGRFIRFSPDGKQAVTTSHRQIQEILSPDLSLQREERNATIWDLQSGQAVATLSGHEGSITDGVFTADGALLVTTSRDRSARIWDIRNRDGFSALSGHKNHVRQILFSTDGSRVLSMTGTSVRVWDVATGQALATIDVHDADHDLASDAVYDRDVLLLERVPEDVIHIAQFTPDGSRVYTVSTFSDAALWDAQSGDRLATFKAGSDRVWAGRVLASGDRVVTAGTDGRVETWDVATQRVVGSFVAGDDSGLVSGVFSPDGSQIAFLSTSGLLQVWDAHQSVQMASHRLADAEGLTLLAMSADGRQVAFTWKESAVRIWHIDSGELGNVLQGHDGPVFDAAFSADGTRLVTASDDNSLRIWDAGTGETVAVLAGHSNRVTGVVFGGHGNRLVSGGYDGTARLWDAQSGTELAVFRHATEPKQNYMNAIAFSPQQTLVATATTDTVRLWPVYATTQSLVDQAKAAVPRCLSRQQRVSFFLDPEPPAWCYTMGKVARPQ